LIPLSLSVVPEIIIVSFDLDPHQREGLACHVAPDLIERIAAGHALTGRGACPERTS
jgi:hypothetical protein